MLETISAGIFSILFLALAILGLIKFGPNILSTIILAISLPILIGVTLVVFLDAWLTPKKCPRCHISLRDERPIEWCRFCGWLVRPEQLTKELEPWTRSQNTEDLVSSKGRGVRTVGVLLWRMIVDGADELALLPSEDDYRLVALVDGREMELEPPPLFLHRPTVATLRAMWGSDPNGDLPLSGVLRVHTDEGSAIVEATVAPTPAGDSIRFLFSYPGDNSAESPIPQPAAMV